MSTQLTEHGYDRASILLRAIKATYNVYTQLYLFGPIETDLRECCKSLVTSFLWTRILDLHKHFQKHYLVEGNVNFVATTAFPVEVNEVVMIIEECCQNKGEGYQKKFLAELQEWSHKIKQDYQTFLKNEANIASGDQAGGVQV